MWLCRYILITIIIIIIKPIIITVNKSVSYLMRRNYGHKSTAFIFHTPRVKQYFHFQEVQRSLNNLPKVCRKSHDDQHQCKKKYLPTVGGGTPPTPSPLSLATLHRFAPPPPFTEFLDPHLKWGMWVVCKIEIAHLSLKWTNIFRWGFSYSSAWRIWCDHYKFELNRARNKKATAIFFGKITIEGDKLIQDGGCGQLFIDFIHEKLVFRNFLLIRLLILCPTSK